MYFVPVTLKLVRQELSFTVELTLDLACRLETQNILFSFSPVLFVLRT